MKRIFARRRTLLFMALVILIISQFSFFKPIRDISREAVARPVQWLSKTSGKIGTAIRLIGSIDNLSHENSLLRQQNTELQAKLSQLETTKGENDKLRLDLNFKQTRPDLTLIPAQIISFSPENGFQVFTINKGEKDGLKLEQAVISSGFLIGKIKNVSANTSEVWQLSNRNLLTPVTLAKSQTTGILRGSISGLIVENIPVDSGASKGEVVVTSSLEGLYPSGIAIGTVEDILSKKEEIFLTVRINAPINIRNLGTVFAVEPTQT